jgi:hypothetical protein
MTSIKISKEKIDKSLIGSFGRFCNDNWDGGVIIGTLAGINKKGEYLSSFGVTFEKFEPRTKHDLSQMIKDFKAPIKYYKYKDDYSGIKYFKVGEIDEDVTQVIYTHKEKKGRAYCLGITKIKYTTFISSYGWKIKESKYCIQVEKSEYEDAFSETLLKLK